MLTRPESGSDWPMLLWRPGPGWRMVSSAPLGGGIGVRHWVLNAQVPGGYARMDPATHLAELAAYAGAVGPGVGLMTAARVREGRRVRAGGVEALVTAGVGVRGWAAVPEATLPEPAVPEATAEHPEPPAPEAHVVGTINTLVLVPCPLSDAALVNAVSTATEAKVQALLEVGLDASGTPTDAVCVAAPEPSPASPEATALFAGPRSLWGARVARAVHRATVLACVSDPCVSEPGASGAE